MGKKNSTTTSQVTIPPEVLARYNAVNARAENVAATPFKKFGTTASDFVAQLNEQEKSGIADINAAAGAYKPYFDKASTLLSDATTSGLSGTKTASDLANAATASYDPYLSKATSRLDDATAGGLYGTEEAYNETGEAASSYDPYLSAATSATTAGMGPAYAGIDKYMSPYIQNVADTTGAMLRQANEQAQSGALGRAASSGAFGGDRAGVAAANLSNQQGMAYGKTMADIYNQGYTQALGASERDLARLTEGGKQLSDLGLSGANLGLLSAAQKAKLAQQGYDIGSGSAKELAALGLSGANLGLTNASKQGEFAKQGYEIGSGSAEKTAGLGAKEQELGLAGANAKVAAGSLERKTEQAGKDALRDQFMKENGYPFEVATWLAGIMTGTGAASGSTTTTTQPSSFFSDRRLKEDVQRIGEGDNGLPIYKYRYKGEPETHIGFMADEVEKVRPDAVGLHPTGYKTVDYDRATKAEGGGVAGPYGSQGYVPQANLNVRELMVADPAFLQNAQASLAEQLGAASDFGTNLANLKEKFGKDGDFWMSNEQRRALKAANQRTAHGGVVGNYASGGPAYMRHDDPQMGTRSYLSDALDAQSDQDKKSNGLAPPTQAPQARSTGEDVVDIAKIAMKLFGMNRGGRAGYATNGAVEDMTPEERRQYIADLRAFAVRNPGVARDASSERVNPVAFLGGEAGAPPQSQYAPSASLRPQARPEGLVSPLAPMTSRRPLPRSPFGAVDQMNPEDRSTLTADLRGFAARDPGIARSASASGLNPVAYLGGDAAAPVPSYAPETSLRPQPRPTGLVPEAVPMEDLTAAGITGGVAPLSAATTTPKFTADGLKVVPVSDTTIGGLKPNQTAEPMGWTELAPKIKARESGGDYDALYGFSNREDGPFAGTKVTDMTVDQAIQFSDPNGPYGQWSKQNLGYVATPMGAYQIVGSTLRDIKENMGLSGDEKMTPDLQEAMAKWLYQNRGGATPWAASEGAGAVSGGLAPVNANAAPGALNVSGGLAGPAREPMGGDKAYEDRTTLGKMFYNPDGRVNKDALLSILGGIGTMASSPSRYLGSAILQGIGGAANTYAGLEKQRGEVAQRNIANMSELNDLYNNFMFTNPQYSGMKIDDFAKAQGLEYLLPQGGLNFQTAGGPDQTGKNGALPTLSLADVRGNVAGPKGVSIPFMNDYASLNQLVAQWGAAKEGTPQRTAAEQARLKLAEIEQNGYTTGIAADGTAITIPVDAVLSKRGMVAADEANNIMTQDFRNKAAGIMETVPGQLQNVQKQIEVYQSLPAGSFTSQVAQADALLRALGVNVAGLGEGEIAALAQEAIKLRAQGIVEVIGANATSPEMELVGKYMTDPNMQPEAVKFVLAMQQAVLKREYEKADMHALWQRTEAKNPNDLVEYQKWFAENHPLDKYIKEANAKMPPFAGERETDTTVPKEIREGSTDKDQYGRDIVYKNGKWVLVGGSATPAPVVTPTQEPGWSAGSAM